MVYIEENNISGYLKNKFDTLGEEREMEIKIEEPMQTGDDEDDDEEDGDREEEKKGHYTQF